MEVASLPATALKPAGSSRVAPTSLVVFGVTGDLAQRKLLPALHRLARDGVLPRRFNLIGSALRPLTSAEFRRYVAEAVRRHSRRAPDEELLQTPLDGFLYVQGRCDPPEAHRRIAQVLQELGQLLAPRRPIETR